MAMSNESKCKGVIPNTFIMCGEGGNFCSGECMAKRADAFPGFEGWAEHVLTSGGLDSELRDVGAVDILHVRDALIEAFLKGAAVAFGVVGWALALRRNAPRCPSKREYWTSDLDGKRYYNCFCACCEHAYLKALEAGVDEGTDYEWCGECLYRQVKRSIRARNPRCNASLEWHGDVPDAEEDRLCHSCIESDRDHLRGVIATLEKRKLVTTDPSEAATCCGIVRDEDGFCRHRPYHPVFVQLTNGE